MVRMWRWTGDGGVRLGSGGDPVADLVRLAVGVTAIGAALWCVLVAAVGPDALGVWRPPLSLRVLAVAALAAGWLLVVVAQRQMGLSWRIGIDAAPTELVATGLYRVSRNPIYLGMIAVAAGLAAAYPCAWTIVGSLVTVFVLALQARLEEQHLARVHGEAYRAYAARVGRFVPWMGRAA